MEKRWKNYLLKSGLPLEYEVAKIFEDKGCVGSAEYSYFRTNEENRPVEFSYDLDYCFIGGDYFIDLMVECKYRDPSVKWLFLPKNYGDFDEVFRTDFLNASDYFIETPKFPSIEYNLLDPLAPLCGKGIEILSNNFNPKSISQAISQLSYAFSGKLIDGFESQFHNVNQISLHIPIIVTTAELYRIKDGLTINELKNSQSLDEVASKADLLILQNSTSIELEKYNQKAFGRFVAEHGKKWLEEKLNSFNKDLDHVLSVIASYYSPKAFLILNHNDKSYEKLFDYINEVIFPSDKTLKKIDIKMQERAKRMEEFSKRYNI